MTEDEFMSFGEKIRELREEKEINQTELGIKTGMTQRRISYLETGKYEPSIEDIRQLCLFFGVSGDYLLNLPEGMRYPKR